MPEIDKSVLDGMVAKVKPEKRLAFLADFKARGYTIKGASAAPPEEGITPENPMETATNLIQAAGTLIKSRGLSADKRVFGAKPSDSAGGVLGAVGEGVEKTGKFLGDMTPKTPGDVGMMELTGGAIEGIGVPAYNKFLARSPEVKAAIDKAVGTAKDLGFRLMPSQETGSNFLGLVETLFRKLPGSAAIVDQYERAQRAGYIQARDKILTDLGSESETQFGGSLKEALSKSNDAIVAKADALLKKGQLSQEAYEKAISQHEQRLASVASDSLKGQRTSFAARLGGSPTAEGRGLAAQLERAHQVALDDLQQQALWDKALGSVPREVDQTTAPNLLDASGRIAKRLKDAGMESERVYKAATKNLPEAESEEVKGLLAKARASGAVSEAADEGPKTYTLKALQDKQAFYAQLAEGHRDPVTGKYDAFGNMFRDLHNAIQKDMDGIFSHAGVPAEAKQSYQIAKAFTKEKMGLADLQVVRGLWKENPSAIMDSVVKAGDRKGTQTLIQALGGGDAGRAQVKRHIFDEAFGAGDEAVPSRDKVMAALSKYSENISSVFSKDEQKQLYAMADKTELPKFLNDQYDKRVKEILDRYSRQRAAILDPRLSKLAGQEPQALVNSVLKGDPDVVRAIRKYVTPQQFERYQMYGMRDLLADPRLPQSGVSYIKDELAKKPEFYKELLGEKNWEQMQHIGDAQLLLPGFKDLARPSTSGPAGYGRAQMGMAATFGVMGLIIHPFSATWGRRAMEVGAGLVIAPPVLAKLYMSEPGRRLVTTLLRLPQADERAAYLVGQLGKAGYLTALGAQRTQQGGTPGQ